MLNLLRELSYFSNPNKHRKYPFLNFDSREIMTAKHANPCLKEVLDHGRFMEVFAWEDVKAHKDLFMKLMASYNFDSEMTMGEDEFSCATPSLRTFKHSLQNIA